MMKDYPSLDPDQIAETLCIGKFNVSITGPLATMTFTHARPKTAPLFDNSVVELENIVRARIVTTLDTMIALRDLLNKAIPDPSLQPPSEMASTSLN